MSNVVAVVLQVISNIVYQAEFVMKSAAVRGLLTKYTTENIQKDIDGLTALEGNY